jgi:magnesium transporter
VFLVFRTARYDDAAEAIEFSEIQLFAGERFVITVRHGAASALTPVRQQLESEPDRLALGPIAVVHAILDRVVDDYMPVLGGLDNDIAEIEGQVFSAERNNPAERIYKLKRQVLELFRNVEPLIEPLDRLHTGWHPFGAAGVDLGPYFRDINDHLRREVARIEVQRELLTEVLNVNLAHISMQQNEDMRRISGWVAIAAVPTMLAGLWGMNFRHMPELDESWGYPLALGIMATVSLSLFYWLRKRRWI